MTNKKISQLPSGSAIVSGNLFAVVQNGITTKISASQVLDYITSSVFNSLNVNNLSASHLTASRALINNNLIIGGDLAVNGGDITSTQTILRINAGGTVEIQDNLIVTGTINSTSTISSSGNIITAGDLAVNGGDITSTATVLNITAGTTVNINDNLIITGTINSTSTISSSGNIITAGDLAVNGGDITSTSPVLNLNTGKIVSGTTAQFTTISGTYVNFGQATSSQALISGDLRVLGTASINQLNTINQTSLVVGDKYITILSGGVDHTGINGAGILWGTSSGPGETTGALGEHAHILYDSGRDALEIFPGLYVSGSTTLFGISGTIAQFTTITGSTVSGNTAQFTTITASVISASLFIGPGIGGGGGSSGSVFTSINVITQSITLDNLYHTIYADATNGSITVTLPSASLYNGIEYFIKRVDTSTTNIVTVSASVGDLIDGFTYIPLNYRYEGITLQTNNTSSWHVSAEVSAEITLLAQGYINPVGSNNLYIFSSSAAGGNNNSIQFNNNGILSGSDNLTYEQSTSKLSGVIAQFTTVTASVISASQYVGLTGGGDVTAAGNNTFTGINNFNNKYITASVGITGSDAKFTFITASIISASQYIGLTSNGGSGDVTTTGSNTFTGINTFNINYVTASAGITGSDAKFTRLTASFITASVISASQFIGVSVSTNYAIIAEGYVSSSGGTFSEAGVASGPINSIQFNSGNYLTGSSTLTYNNLNSTLNSVNAQFTTITASIISASQYVGLTGGGDVISTANNTFTGINAFNINYLTASVGITGSTAKFTTLTASVISASQYFGLTGGGDVTSTANNTFTGINTFNNKYITASAGITGSDAKFTFITASIISASQYIGAPSSDITSTANNTFTGINTFNNKYITASAGITGSDAKFTTITGNLFGTASFANSANTVINGVYTNTSNTFTSVNTFNNVYITASVGITGSDAKFSILTASIISASQYIGLGNMGSSPGGQDQSIQFNSSSQLSGTSNLTYNYNTNILSGTVAQFTTLTSSLYVGRLKKLTTFTQVVTSNSTLTDSQHVILASASVSNITLTLPLVINSAYQQYIVKKIDPTVNKIIISGSSSEKIDGLLGREINTQYETVTLTNDGASQWFIL